MKCRMCNGTGKTEGYFYESTEMKGIYKQVNVTIKCNNCNGTGEIEQTNFEFMQSCTMEEMVDTIAKIKCEGYAIWPSMEEIKQDVRDWLQEGHDG